MEQLNLIPSNDFARGQAGESGKETSALPDRTPPTSTGQCGQVLNLIRELQPVVSFDISISHAIPELAARVHELRNAGWNVVTTIRPVVLFRGVERKNVALYSLGTPEWPRPGFFDDAEV